MTAAATFRAITPRDILKRSLMILLLYALPALSSRWDEFMRNISVLLLLKSIKIIIPINTTNNKILSDLISAAKMGYNMHVVWDNDSNFIFNSWRSESDGGLALGIILSFIVAFFSVSFSFFKDKVLTGSRIKVTLAYVINYAIKLLIMFLLMSMNGWVCAVIILGITAGQIGFEYLSKRLKWKKVSKNTSVLSEQQVSAQ